MVKEVYKNGHQLQTVDDLREANFTTWSNVPTKPSGNTCIKDVFEVINKNSGATHFCYFCFRGGSFFFRAVVLNF